MSGKVAHFYSCSSSWAKQDKEDNGKGQGIQVLCYDTMGQYTSSNVNDWQA